MDERIIEFSFRPVQDKRRALPVFLGVLSLSAVLVVLATFLSKYHGVVSFFAMLGLCASVLIFTRYYIADFVYSTVLGSDGEVYFVITRITGKRESAMCTLRYSEITGVRFLDGDAAKSYKPEPVSKKYNFVPDFSPKSFYLITALSRGGGKSEIMISGTPDLAKRIEEYAAIARERAQTDEY